MHRPYLDGFVQVMKSVVVVRLRIILIVCRCIGSFLSVRCCVLCAASPRPPAASATPAPVAQQWRRCDHRWRPGGATLPARTHAMATTMARRWARWVLAELALPLLKEHFYVTESEVCRQEVSQSIHGSVTAKACEVEPNPADNTEDETNPAQHTRKMRQTRRNKPRR
eukprot:6641205-Pyramimonas_sp.AAC.1